MASVNRVILIGNLGRDPEVRKLSNGNSVCNLRIATSDTWKDKATGEKKEKTEWHQVVIFDEHIVKFCENYLNKGSKVYIEGALQTRKWTDQAGVEKYSTEICLQKFRGVLQSLDAKGGGGEVHAVAKNEGYQKDKFHNGDLDDEIPFVRW